MQERKDIPEESKWDLSKFYRDEKECYAHLKKFENYKTLIAKYEGKLSNDDTLLELLKLEDKISEECGRLGVYVFVRQSEDVRNSQINELAEEFDRVMNDYSMASAYIDVEIADFSDEKLKGLIKNPRFADYKRTFESYLKAKKHILSKKEEKLISGMSFLGGFSDNFDKFDDGDLKFNKVKDSKGRRHELTHSAYRELAESRDATLRKNTYIEFNGAYGRYINFLSNNYINKVKQSCYFAKIRGYKSSLSASIFNEEASEEVYNRLIKKVHSNIDIFYDYMEIKRKMLGLDKISIVDSFAPIAKNVSKKYTYDEAIELIKKAVAPLGDEYVKLIQRAKDERWIDVYPNAGKDSGAYSIHAYGITPLVLTNFTGTLDSVFTLAHELGHALHSYFSMTKQKIQTSEYVIFVAEVASTTNEMLLLRYLMQRAKSTSEKIYYLDKLFSDVKSTIFRQTMFSEFEQITHAMYERGEPLSKDKLSKEYYKLNQFYFGDKVELVDEVKYEWARIPHFFRSFYVYKYATGLISALNFSEKIFNGDLAARDKYLGFLSAGCSDTPIKILQKAGCDLEKDEIFDDVFAYLRKQIKTWINLLK